MRFKQVAKGIMGVMLAVALTGCASGNSKQEDAAKEKLVVQFVPTNNDGTMEAKAKPFAEYLSKKLDRQVDVTWLRITQRSLKQWLLVK